MSFLRALWKHRGWIRRAVEIVEAMIAQRRSNRAVRSRLARRLAEGLVLTDDDLERLRSAQSKADRYMKTGK